MMPAVGNLAGGHTHPVDVALREVEAAIARAREAGAPRAAILERVANGLTGALGGYRERLLTKALISAANLTADLTSDAARAIERSVIEVVTVFRTMTVWDEASEERERAHAKHGDRSMESTPWHDPVGRRLRVLLEEVGEVAKEINDAEVEDRPINAGRLRRELVQVAAMAGAWADVCPLEEATTDD